ncbi:MAG: SxtJ family membrane protein [Phaeospirillum sp.]|nr:SxtJ family membrane protein [Phaeospirillum sp.]
MSKPQETFEGQSHGRKVEMGTDRSFGLVFAVVFAIVCLLPLWSGAEPRLWAGVVAGAFLVASFVAPKLLKPLNRLWFLVGMALHHVVTPVVMGLLFFLTVTPIGLIRRAMGKDSMCLRRDDAAASYWVVRQPPGPASGSMRRQF